MDNTNDETPRKRSREEFENSNITKDKNLVPAFLTKTYEIMHNPEYEQYISWNEDNDAIRINDVAGFSSHVVPHFFKHSNFASFVRQLNMYGFHKTKQDPDWREFQHQFFRRGREDLLKNIKRRNVDKNKDIDLDTVEQIKVLQDKFLDLERKYDYVLNENILLRQEINIIKETDDNSNIKYNNINLVVNYLLKTMLEHNLITNENLYQITNDQRQDNLLLQPELSSLTYSYPLIKGDQIVEQSSNPYLNNSTYFPDYEEELTPPIIQEVVDIKNEKANYDNKQ